MSLLLLLACAHRADPTPATERERALYAADALWAARAEEGKLDAAVEAWRGLLALDPDDPDALARLARAEWTRAQLSPADPTAVESAQDYGWRCLLAWPSFSAALAGAGYAVTPEAAAELPVSAAPCLLWTVVPSLAIVGTRGPGAALELEAAGVLLARLEALDAAGPLPLDPGFLPWARARYLVLSAAPEPPPADARGRFSAAIAAAPEVGLFRRDLVAAFPDAANVAWAGFVPAGEWARENAAWGATEGTARAE